MTSPYVDRPDDPPDTMASVTLHRCAAALLVENGRVLLAHRHPDRRWVVGSWTGRVENRAPEEHDELRWVTLRDIGDLDLAHPAYRALIADVLSD